MPSLAQAALNQSSYRFLSNLDNPDPTFINSNPSTGDDTVSAAAVDNSNANLFIAGHNGTWLVEKRSEIDGSLVSAFGTSGRLTQDIAGSTNETIGAIATDPTSDAIYIGGVDYTNGVADAQWRIEKRNYASGLLVSGFGTGGVISSNPTTGNDIITSIILDVPGGYVYTAGYDSTGGNQWRIEKRLMSTGGLVSGFGTGGVFTINPSNQDDKIRTIDLDPTNQYLYVAGADEGSGNTAWRLDKRRASDAALCTAAICGTQFGTGGTYTSNPSSRGDAITALQVDDAGNAIYAGGYDAAPGNNNDQWRIEKIDLNTGSLITAFGTSGALTVNPSTNIDQITDMTLDGAGGFIYVKGYDNTGNDTRWRIEKRQRSNGALVTTFGTSGVVTSNPSANNDQPVAVAIDVDRGLLFGVGMDRALGVANQQFRIEQYQLDSGGHWLAAANTVGAASTNTSFRLRMLLHTTNAIAADGSTQLKLQYALKVGTCDTGFIGEDYADVTASSTEIRYHDNPTLADATTAVAVSGDPTHGSDTSVLQSIEELNNFTNPASLLATQDGLWDFVLRDAEAFGAYCFRAVDSSGSVLDAYTVIPEITFCKDDPKTDSVLRHGAYFCEGTERSFFWSKD